VAVLCLAVATASVSLAAPAAATAASTYQQVLRAYEAAGSIPGRARPPGSIRCPAA
jgi:hypothetical protein